MWIVKGRAAMMEPKVVIEEVTDPVETARHWEQDDQFKRNLDWIQSHWSEISPADYGKYLAVAGQQIFLADSPQKARALAEGAHPNDKGIWVHYLRPPGGPRIYGNRWPMARRS